MSETSHPVHTHHRICPLCEACCGLEIKVQDQKVISIRGHEADLYTRAVDIVVSRLRKKLEPLDCIKTLRNAGYSLALRREA